MAEVFKGTLIFKGEGKDRRRFLGYISKKGKPMNEMVSPEKLAASLRVNPEAEIAVDFELDPSGRPFRVRASGEVWTETKPQVAELSQHRSQSRKPQGGSSGDFHNPYSFIPAPPRKSKAEVPESARELCDREPIGHDQYYDEHFSGTLKVRMTVETPLLLADTPRVSVHEHDHKSFPVRVDEGGKPAINPTAIKGMLRSAYEAVTNSRLSVFKDHTERLAFRGEAKTPTPARIEMHKGTLHIRKFRTAAVLVRYRKHWSGEKDKLEKDDTARTPTVPGRAMKFSGSSNLPQHGQAVWVRISDRVSTRGRTTGRPIGKKVDEIRLRTIGSTAPRGFVEGWACITGANTKDKVYERVFVEPFGATTPVTDHHIRLWKELISNYQMIHEEDLKKRKKKRQLPADYLGDNPGETAWSRQIHSAADLNLDEGALCYLIEQDVRIKALLPVMISRILYPDSPQSLLLPESHPALKTGDLSPADRVFGWVRQSDKEKNKKLSEVVKKLNAYRGQLRVGFVECKPDKADAIKQFEESLPLQILGQPKPQQGRFYVAQDQYGEAQEDGLSAEESGYRNGKGLRGRKVYPHHKVTEDYWRPQWPSVAIERNGRSFYQEYRRPDGENQRDNQNRSVKGWVNPGTEFAFDIHFVNLSDVELGALLWLLKLPPNHFHRFGGGKPLGFGSVRLDLVSEKSEIQRGKELAESRYASLDEDTKSDKEKTAFEKLKNERIRTIVEAFQNAVAAVYGGKFDEAKFIKAFLKAASGFTKPIHYPRTDKEPRPEGESFKWFVDNNSRYGYKLALPNIYEDDGFPLRPKD